ncbi:antirestriction protein ArdR [Erwinia amylovora]|uniref:antirestriction protein ArdR n=1 Tax=Erwinia amylovora TaxID=552 RepID=UPI001443EC7A|nr:antirestriction protein ArdR [Erwinia amylovora]
MNHVDIADAWRLKNQDHADSGVVLIWGGKVYGWKNLLRDASHERPGAIAVDTAGHVFIAEGRNDSDRAKCWVVFEEP